MRVPGSLLTKKGFAITAGVGFFVVMVSFFLLLTAVFGDKDTSQQWANQSTSKAEQSEDSSGSGGTYLQSDIRKIIGNVSSTRNLKGLTLRINQIDVCQLPDLTAYVAVATDQGDVAQLTSSDVKVYVDSKEVSKPQFSRIDSSRQPLSATLVIDRSGSMKGAPIEQARTAAQSFVTSASPQDKIALVQFDNEVNVLQQLTTDHAAVKNSIGQIGVRGDTALYDALAQGITTTSGCSRRAVLLLSDGGDTASKNSSLDSAINAANLAGIPAFVVGLRGETYDANVLRSITERTGGQLFETSNPAELAGLYAKIDQQLRGQYYIGLKLSIPKDGKEHRLKIVSIVGGSPTTSERSFFY